MEAKDHQISKIGIGYLSVKKQTIFTCELNSSHEYIITGIADNQIQSIEIALYDKYRNLVCKDRNKMAIVRVKPNWDSTYQVVLNAYNLNVNDYKGNFIMMVASFPLKIR